MRQCAWGPVFHLFNKYLSSVDRVPRTAVSAGNEEENRTVVPGGEVGQLCARVLHMRARVMSPCPQGQGARAVPPASWSVTSALPVPCPLSKAGVDCEVGPFVPSPGSLICATSFSAVCSPCAFLLNQGSVTGDGRTSPWSLSHRWRPGTPHQALSPHLPAALLPVEGGGHSPCSQVRG